MNLTIAMDGYPGHEHSLPITRSAKTWSRSSPSRVSPTPDPAGPTAAVEQNYFYER
jgi:hypothetical protein